MLEGSALGSREMWLGRNLVNTPQSLGSGGAWRDPEGRGLEGRDEALMGVV